MPWSERSLFRVFIGVVLIIGIILVYRDRHMGPLQDPTLGARAVWTAAGISNYEYRITYYSGGGTPPPMQVFVRGGKVESAKLWCIPPRTDAWCREWQENWKDIYGPEKLPNHAETVPQLFDHMAAFVNMPYKPKIRV